VLSLRSHFRRSKFAFGAAGRVTSGEPGRVAMRTVFGGSRIVDMLVGEQLPRIC
jgi:hydrogenase maturation factor